MKEIKGYLITTGIILIVLAGLFYCGYRYYPIRNPCPEPVTETVFIHDTVVHHIVDTVPFYIVRRDSVVKWREVPAFVDTIAILADYYLLHYYTRTWKDSLLRATSEDVITENQFIGNRFTYQILRPQKVIYNTVDNSVSYSSYLYGALSVPTNDVKFANLGIYFANKQLLLGIGYMPYAKGINATAGIKIAKFKK